jgi:hypothetical protein
MDARLTSGVQVIEVTAWEKEWRRKKPWPERLRRARRGGSRRCETDTRGDDATMKRGAHPTTRYVKTDDGIHIGYQVFREGPYDLVLNDGWMTNVDATGICRCTSFFSKLGERARVIMFDRRGFGISDRPSRWSQCRSRRAWTTCGLSWTPPSVSAR